MRSHELAAALTTSRRLHIGQLRRVNVDDHAPGWTMTPPIEDHSVAPVRLRGLGVAHLRDQNSRSLAAPH